MQSSFGAPGPERRGPAVYRCWSGRCPSPLGYPAAVGCCWLLSVSSRSQVTACNRFGKTSATVAVHAKNRAQAHKNRDTPNKNRDTQRPNKTQKQEPRNRDTQIKPRNRNPETGTPIFGPSGNFVGLLADRKGATERGQTKQNVKDKTGHPIFRRRHVFLGEGLQLITFFLRLESRRYIRLSRRIPSYFPLYLVFFPV